MSTKIPNLDEDEFTILEHGERERSTLYEDYAHLTSAKTADKDVQYQDWLRKNHAGLNLTVIPSGNAPLLPFAYAGNATATLDTETEPVVRWRGYVTPSHRGGTGGLGDATFFAKYHYAWAGEDFIIYSIGPGNSNILYILKEPDTAKGETALTHCSVVDKLILTAVQWSQRDSDKYIYVFDGYWGASRDLWDQIQKAEWENVILDPKEKKALTSVSNTFFDSEEVYRRYGVPWKRGLIFYGPPGNGKTISIKALMHELYRREKPIPTLYVKSASTTYNIRAVFSFARSYSPCLLVMEDIETIVTSSTRSYFFNEVDGLENNDGILMVASTNYLDRLDPGLAKRPSRFDRKYLFPLPSRSERTLYAAFWRGKLAKSAPKIDFPEKLCKAIADITDKFSFAYMQEAFVAALLDLARTEMEQELYGDQGGEEVGAEEGEVFWTSKKEDLDKYPLWKALKTSIALLREQIGGGEDTTVEGDEVTLPQEMPLGQDRCLTALSFAFTGTLPSLTRAKAEDLINLHGGTCTAAVLENTRYVVLGKDPGSKKMRFIQDNGLKTIDEDGLLDLIQSKHSAFGPGAPFNYETVAFPVQTQYPNHREVQYGGDTRPSSYRFVPDVVEQSQLDSTTIRPAAEASLGPSLSQLGLRARLSVQNAPAIRRNGRGSMVTEQQLTNAGIGKYQEFTPTAYEQVKMPWD